jgi:DNA repair exonuclease SbcCD nuclease subunit
MYPVRYIHAADLHLDAAFRGIERESGLRSAEAARLLREAAFTAAERLFALAEKERPDFLVIAGDIYNQEDGSIRAQLRLRDACARLLPFGVRVFLAHGNHDPLPSRLRTLNWPPNVTIFGADAESFPVRREGETVAVVHGISHERANESRNLARLFRRGPEACFQLGVLHCTPEGAGAERYAPCSLDDLRASGFDAWALGHVHERTVLSERSPFVLYPGNTQGLHIGERGERGCMLVNAAPSEEGFACSAVFKPLGPVIWELCAVDVEGAESMDVVDTALRDALEKFADEAPRGCEAALLRLRLTGRTPLDAELRRPGTSAELSERLREAAVQPMILIKDIEPCTRPEADAENLRGRDDLLGEALRLAEAGRASPETLRALVDSCLQPLSSAPGLRKLLPFLSDEEREKLLAEAERLCIDVMETG